MSQPEVAPPLLTPEEYLAALDSMLQKHEYLGGVVYAMAGGKPQHSRLAVNVILSLGTQLRGRKCEIFNSDMLVRVRLVTHTRFYFPDAHVICEREPEDQLFHDAPVVIIEVVSESTRRADEWEKREAYLTINSLSVYILLEQEFPRATVWRRRSSGFSCEAWVGLEAIIPLPEIASSLPLADLYTGAEFPPPSEDSP